MEPDMNRPTSASTASRATTRRTGCPAGSSPRWSPAAAGGPGGTADSGGRDPRLRREHPAHARPPSSGSARSATSRLPLGHPPPRRGRDRRLRASGRARIYFGDEVRGLHGHVEEGDWVFVPPFMPHVECNLSRTKPLDLDDHPHPGEHRRQPARRRRRRPARTGWTAARDRRRRVDAGAALERRRSSPRPSPSTPAEPEHFDLAFTAVTQPCPWPKAYGGDLVAPGRGGGDALGDRRQDAALDAQLLPAPGRHRRRRSATRWNCCATGAATAPARSAATRTASRSTSPGQLRRGRAGRHLRGQPGEPLAGRDIPGPEDLPSSAAYLDAPGRTAAAERRSMTERSRAYWSGGRSFDMRHVPGPVYLTVEGERVPHQAIWLRPYDALRPVARAERRAARPRRARLRVRLHDPRAGAARPRPAVGKARAGHRQPGSRHVVPPRPGAAVSTTGCSTPRRRSRPTPAAAWAPASSSPAITVTWPPWSRKECSVRPDRGRIPPMPPADRTLCHRRRLRRHVHPRPPAAGGPVAGDRVHHPGALQYPDRLNAATELIDVPAATLGADRPAAAHPGRRDLDLRRAQRPGRTRWRRCSPRTSAWCRASGCCCARRTTRGRSPPGSACSRPAASS